MKVIKEGNLSLIYKNGFNQAVSYDKLILTNNDDGIVALNIDYLHYTKTTSSHYTKAIKYLLPISGKFDAIYKKVKALTNTNRSSYNSKLFEYLKDNGIKYYFFDKMTFIDIELNI